MQTISVSEEIIPFGRRNLLNANTSQAARASTMVWGIHKKIIKAGIWLNITILSLYIFKNPLRALKAAKKLSTLKNKFRDNHTIIKYAKVNGKYYFTSTAPGWP